MAQSPHRFETNDTIEKLFQKFKSLIGKDYESYRNHVYRVFLNCILIDNEADSREKYAIAAVFHDIGIWTDHTFDYLDPSEKQAELYLMEVGKPEWIEEITSMIQWHHKISSYRGNDEKTVNTFRKADWIDVSLGLITFGYGAQQLKETRRRLPNLGFHFFLLRETSKNFLKHPFNPLPMFRK